MPDPAPTLAACPRRSRCRPHLFGAGAAAALALTFAGCSGGGGASGPAPTGPTPPPPPTNREFDATAIRPVTRRLTRRETIHLLTRTGFGATAEQVAQVERKGLDLYVQDLVFFRLDPVQNSALAELRDPDFPDEWEIVDWWLHQMTRNANPFQDVLAMFWHDHFATSQIKLERESRHLMLRHIEKLRWTGNTDLRQLLVTIVEDGATQIWLDGTSNAKGSLNLNLAREFFELFALGRNVRYTQDDIEETARAFTGYTLETDPATGMQHVVFDPDRHDGGNKWIFGIRGPFDLDDVVDLTLTSRPVAEYVCAKLFEYFCYPDPPQPTVDALAEIMRENRYALKPVLHALLTSEAFFSKRSRVGRIKSPVEYLVGFVRTTGLDHDPTDLQLSLNLLQQLPTYPPNVGGWPDETAWLSESAALDRVNATNRVITDREHQSAYGVDLTRLLPEDRPTPTAVVDHVSSLMGVPLTDDERAILQRYLNTFPVLLPGGELNAQFEAFDATNPVHLDARLRGLLFVLAQHPEYSLR